MLPPPPPSVTALPAGTTLIAGLGTSTVTPDLDFETYSEAGYVFDEARGRWQGPPGAPGTKRGLEVCGVEPYVRHPTFRIVWMAYDLKDGKGPREWRPGLPPPQDLFDHIQAGGLLEGWNVGFERWVWELHCVARLGWPAVAERQWRCAMAKARAFALPGGLGPAGKVLDLAVQKDERGVALMKMLSMPRNPTKADPRRVIEPIYNMAEGEAAAVTRVLLAACADPTVTNRSLVTRVKHAVAQATEECVATVTYGQYNRTDIAAEAEVAARCPDLEGYELSWWRAHERINRRGVHMDRASIENAIAVVEQAFDRYNGELLEITGIDSATKVEQLQGWLRGRGVHLDSLDDDAVAGALKVVTDPVARRVLEIRQAVGSASIKKLFAMRLRLSDDDRLRDLYIFFGARTGRSTGADVQPTNLPKAGPDTIECGCGRHYGLHLTACPWCHAARPAEPKVVEWNPTVMEDAFVCLTQRSLALMEHVFGHALETIAGCLRGMFDAAPGHDLISTDFNSIEAVGLAMVSGEQWRIDVFRGDGKIYEKSAAMMYRVPYEEFAAWKKRTGQHHPLRQKGKIGELAFGYQGWLGAAQAFGMPGSDEEIKEDILRWRAASPAVEWLWGGQTAGKAWGVWQNALDPSYVGVVDDRLGYGLGHVKDRWNRDEYMFGVEGMAVLALLNPGEWFDVARLNGSHSGVSFLYQHGILYCRLPSGRVLHYHRAALHRTDRGEWGLSYEGWNTNPKNGPVGWIRMNTWGGRLVENIIQATCRDILRFAVINLEEAGYPVVLHVYDEIVAEVREGWGSIDEFEYIVTRQQKWYADWPVRAPGGYRAKRYRKG